MLIAEANVEDAQYWSDLLLSWMKVAFSHKETLAVLVILAVAYIANRCGLGGRLNSILCLVLVGPAFYIFIPVDSFIPDQLGLNPWVRDSLRALFLSLFAYVVQRFALRRLTGKEVFDSGNTEVREKRKFMLNDFDKDGPESK